MKPLKVRRTFSLDQERQAIMFAIVLFSPFQSSYSTSLNRILRTVGAYFGYTVIKNQ